MPDGDSSAPFSQNEEVTLRRVALGIAKRRVFRRATSSA